VPLVRLYDRHAEDCARAAEQTDDPKHRAMLIKLAYELRGAIRRCDPSSETHGKEIIPTGTLSITARPKKGVDHEIRFVRHLSRGLQETPYCVLKELIASTPNVSLRAKEFRRWIDENSLDADWPPRQPMTIAELVAEACAAEWDFTNWCHANGYDISDQDARPMFECLLAYAMCEGRAGLH
jgi:hypothetical protein